MLSSEAEAKVLAEPVMIAVAALIAVIRKGGDIDGPDMFDAVCERAIAVGVKADSVRCDEALEYFDYYYSRELDIYCSKEMRDEARKRPFAHMPR